MFTEQVGDCQNYGPFLGPYYNTGPNLGYPKRDHNFDNPPSQQRPHAKLFNRTAGTEGLVTSVKNQAFDCCGAVILTNRGAQYRY